MRIALITDTYRPRVNGVVTSIDAFAREFRARGHEVHIIAPDFPGAVAEPFLTRIPSHYLFFDPEDRLPNPWLPAARGIVQRKVLSQRFDILHTQTPFSLGLAALSWARSMNAPVLHTYHTMFESYAHYIKFLPRTWTVALARAISRWYCNKMDLVISPSAHMRAVLTSYGVRKPVAVNPTGIQTGLLQNADGPAFRRRHGIGEKTPLLLFMGRIGSEKNIDFLFQVHRAILARMPNVEMMVAGEGPAKECLVETVRQMGLQDRVRFFGYFDPRDWAGCYAAADVFTFASVTETQGLVVTEAMAAGTPVVAVGRMGVADIMDGDKGGFLVEQDVNPFTETVLRLLGDPGLRAKKSSEARAYAQEWSASAMAGRMLGLYEQAIQRTLDVRRSDVGRFDV